MKHTNGSKRASAHIAALTAAATLLILSLIHI